MRDAGARAAAPVVGQALVPLEAADRLLDWLARRHGGGAALRAEAAARLAGRWTPAEDQLRAALRVDNALFAVEERNLFVDEAREARRWARLLACLPRAAAAADEDDDSSSSFARLACWLRAGLDALARLAGRRDGPLGWASSPRVFAVASRLVVGSVAVAGRVADPALADAMMRAGDTLRSPHAHVSRLLMEPWEAGPGGAQV